MPSKPRTLAGILRRRRPADREYNRARRADPGRGVEDAGVSKARWKRLRTRVLRDEPVCRACAAEGRSEPATTVDHVVPVRVRPDLAFERARFLLELVRQGWIVLRVDQSGQLGGIA